MNLQFCKEIGNECGWWWFTYCCFWLCVGVIAVGVIALCCGFGLCEFVLKFVQLNRNWSI